MSKRSKMVRDLAYEMVGQERSLKVKKWSAGKWFGLVEDVSGVAEAIFASMAGNYVSTAELGSRMLIGFLREHEILERVIAESIDPRIDPSEISDWDAEDVIGVLDRIAQLNLTEMLQKKLESLAGRFGKTQTAPTKSKGKNSATGVTPERMAALEAASTG